MKQIDEYKFWKFISKNDCRNWAKRYNTDSNPITIGYYDEYNNLMAKIQFLYGGNKDTYWIKEEL